MVERYERLRRHVLDRRPGRYGGGAGRALLQARGMAVWAKAWQGHGAAIDGGRPTGAAWPPAPPNLPPAEIGAEVVRVLAGIVLAVHQEASG